MAEENENNNAAEAYQNLLKKHNDDANAVALKLFGENYDYRKEIRDLKDKLPKDGAKVLSVDEAKEFEKVQKLLTDAKTDSKGLKEILEKFPTLETENRKLSKTETLFELAETGFDGSKLKRSVLREQVFDKYPDAQITFKTETKDGKEAKVAYIATDGKEPVTFAEFAKTNIPDYIPALKETAEVKPAAPGHGFDPKPSDGSADTEADAKAKTAQAHGFRSRF